MKIKSLTLKGFRGFKEETTIEFDEHLNLLVGINGSGKSSVLDALAALLADFEYKGYEGYSILTHPRISQPTYYFEASQWDSTIVNVKCLATVRHSLGYYTWGASDLPHDPSFSFGLPDVGLEDRPFHTSLYFTDNRSLQNNQPQEKQNELSSIPLAKLFIGFDEFQNWYIQRKQYEDRTKLRIDENFVSKPLKLVEEAFYKLFQALSVDAVYSNLSIAYTNTEPQSWDSIIKPTLCIDKNGRTLVLSQLSKGEKMALIMVAEIAFQLSTAYELTHNNPTPKDYSINEVLNYSGIVLIDEIELHLHPRWQRTIIPALRSIFPNIQFIITTHSPQVLSGIDKKHILAIDDFKVQPIEAYTKGRDSNAILYEVYGVPRRPPEAQAEFDAYFELLEEDEPNYEQCLAQLEQLEKNYGLKDKDVQHARLMFDMEFGEPVESE